MHRGSIHQWRKSAFQLSSMRKIVLYGISTCFQVLSPSDGQVTHVLLTVRHSFSFGGASSGERKSVRLACISTPPAFVLSQDQTLIMICLNDHTVIKLIKINFAIIACICFNKLKRPTHWFVFLLCSVFKGLSCCVSNFYIISERRLFVNSFLKFFKKLLFNFFLNLSDFLSYHLNRYMSNTFLKSFWFIRFFRDDIFDFVIITLVKCFVNN